MKSYTFDPEFLNKNIKKSERLSYEKYRETAIKYLADKPHSEIDIISTMIAMNYFLNKNCHKQIFINKNNDYISFDSLLQISSLKSEENTIHLSSLF